MFHPCLDTFISGLLLGRMKATWKFLIFYFQINASPSKIKLLQIFLLGTTIEAKYLI